MTACSFARVCAIVPFFALWSVDMRQPSGVQSMLTPRYTERQRGAEEVNWVKRHGLQLGVQYQPKWSKSSDSYQQKVFERNLMLIVESFNNITYQGQKFPDLYQLDDAVREGLQHACEDALGRDIVLQYIGSRAKASASVTSPDLDVDIQVARKGRRAKVPFTNMDMRKVAESLKKLDFVSGVQIGSIAIKFRILGTIPCDLVLRRERPEMFCGLREGNNFSQNCARINSFLEWPPARAAACGLRYYLPKESRPKGILVDTITWRVARQYLGEIGRFPVKWQAFKLFQLVMMELTRPWQDSFFGADLELDLRMMEPRERQKYEPGLNFVANLDPCKHIYFILAYSLCDTVGRQYSEVIFDKKSFATRKHEIRDRMEGLFRQAFFGKS